MSVRTMLPVRRIIIEELCQRWVDRASRPHYREMVEKLSHESLVDTYTLNVELRPQLNAERRVLRQNA